jgi:hypothetical protein
VQIKDPVLTESVDWWPAQERVQPDCSVRKFAVNPIPEKWVLNEFREFLPVSADRFYGPLVRLDTFKLTAVELIFTQSHGLDVSPAIEIHTWA